jgi:hypothetical protein
VNHPRNIQDSPICIPYLIRHSAALEEGINEKRHDETTLLPSIETFNRSLHRAFECILSTACGEVKADLAVVCMSASDEGPWAGYYSPAESLFKHERGGRSLDPFAFLMKDGNSIVLIGTVLSANHDHSPVTGSPYDMRQNVNSPCCCNVSRTL